MAIVTRNILYRNPVNFTQELPLELIYHILWYLPARDLKVVRLVNRLLARFGGKNIFWSELCRLKWQEKLCLQTLPVPSPHVPERCDSDDEMDASDMEEEPMTLDAYLLSIKNFEEHTYDELKPASLHELAYYFPAFHLVEGSWLRAYNLVEHHLETSHLHASVRANHCAISDTQWEFRFSRGLRSNEPQNIIHAFLEYRRDYSLHIVHGHRYWDQPFYWRPLANGTAIRVHEFPPHELGRNSDGYRTMTNQWVCMTSSSEHSFIRDLEELSTRLMKQAIENGEAPADSMDGKKYPFTAAGDRLIKWIDAYSMASGDSRSCWLGAKKKLICLNWREDSSDDDDE